MKTLINCIIKELDIIFKFQLLFSNNVTHSHNENIIPSNYIFFAIVIFVIMIWTRLSIIIFSFLLVFEFNFIWHNSTLFFVFNVLWDLNLYPLIIINIYLSTYHVGLLCNLSDNEVLKILKHIFSNLELTDRFMSVFRLVDLCID